MTGEDFWPPLVADIFFKTVIIESTSWVAAKPANNCTGSDVRTIPILLHTPM